MNIKEMTLEELKDNATQIFKENPVLEVTAMLKRFVLEKPASEALKIHIQICKEVFKNNKKGTKITLFGGSSEEECYFAFKDLVREIREKINE